MGPPFPATVSIATASQARNRRPALSPGGPGRAALALVRPPPRMVQRWLVSRHVAESLARHVWPSVPLVGRGTRRDGAILQVSGCTGQDRARRQGSSPGELEPDDRGGRSGPDYAPRQRLQGPYWRQMPFGRSDPQHKASQSGKAVRQSRNPASQVADYHRTGPRRPSRGPEAYDPRTAEKITSRDTRIVRKIQLEPPE
jgi:hypothetical protein